MTPKVVTIRKDDTHRLIPATYSGESLGRLTDDERQLEDLLELDGATNGRLLGEANQLPGISVHELLFGVPYARIVNAAFIHGHPAGSRFNDPERGAWYAAFELQTAQAEIAFHKALELREAADSADLSDFYLLNPRLIVSSLSESGADLRFAEPASKSLAAFPEAQKWLLKHPRFHMHFTPTPASWMNRTIDSRHKRRMSAQIKLTCVRPT